MIQFNLLPSIKLDYVKSQRNKRLTILFSTLLGGASLAILVLLFIAVQIIQQRHSNNLSADIEQYSGKLKEFPDLDKKLTIQNQLNSLPGLHDKKPVTTRLTKYIKQITPANINISTFTVDFTKKAISIEGSAKALSNINKFVDTLKFTTFKTAEAEGIPVREGNAFSSVVLSGFGLGVEGKTTYSITLNYDEAIFSNAANVELVIPENKITTRSQTEKPELIFEKPGQEAQ